MRKLLLLFLIFIYGCGYQPLYTNKVLNELKFKEIEIQGDKDINRSLISSTFIEQDTENFLYEKIILKNSRTITETSKDSKGIPESFRMTIKLELKIINNGNIIKERVFSEEFLYKNLDNKFDLYEYETNIQKDLIKKITEELIVYLNI